MSILAVGLSPQYARKLIRRREIALREKPGNQTSSPMPRYTRIIRHLVDIGVLAEKEVIQ
jgi:hypothetical protein